MKPDTRFTGLGKDFWAHVRSLSETVGYTERGKGTLRIPSIAQLVAGMASLNLSAKHLLADDGKTPSDYGQLLLDYFKHRADVLNGTVQHQLQTKDQAAEMYARLKAQFPPTKAATMNKQKGEKATIAYLTAMVNILVEAHSQGYGYAHDPRQLTTITQHGMPLRTLSRRVDGAFPAIVNPIAIWEIKEYYHTTTFGSRVADGVYETQLDGLELEEMRRATNVQVQHVLILDAHYTWWECGRSYLCRLIDTLHMGLVGEILFGTEIETRVPQLVTEWVELARAQDIQRDRARTHLA